MAKYKAGDKVRVKNHRVETESLGWIEEMDKMLGKAVTIKAVLEDKFYLINEMECSWADEMFEGLSTGNEIIDLLLKKLGVEVNEEFEIIGSIYSPYKITEKGYLIDGDGDERTDPLVWLILGERAIRKIPKPEIKKVSKPEIKEMTVAELEKALKIPKGTLRVKGDD